MQKHVIITLQCNRLCSSTFVFVINMWMGKVGREWRMKMRMEFFPVEVQRTFPRSELYCREQTKLVFCIFWNMLNVFRHWNSFKSWLPRIVNGIVILEWLSVRKQKLYLILKVIFLHEKKNICNCIDLWLYICFRDPYFFTICFFLCLCCLA
jgi:hypothetical protein